MYHSRIFFFLDSSCKSFCSLLKIMCAHKSSEIYFHTRFTPLLDLFLRVYYKERYLWNQKLSQLTFYLLEYDIYEICRGISTFSSLANSHRIFCRLLSLSRVVINHTVNIGQHSFSWVIKTLISVQDEFV